VDRQYSEKINSTQYWDRRFIADWKENNGIEQSQFFSRIAVDNLPAWFIRYTEQHQPSFCDWGCAMGNGTRVLQELLSLKHITGVDFSRVAIEEARSGYPTITFIAADILNEENFPQFDIIFSSNTLEHFENPWEILEKLSRFAKKFIVILIPFQEYDRHFEHFYTFETTNIPSTVRASHYLIHFSIFNAAAYPSSYWNGHQILLIYSTHSEINNLGLTLSDLIDNKTIDPITETILAKTCEIQDAQKRLQEYQGHLNQSFTDHMQNTFRLKEQLDLASDALNKRLDGIDVLLTKNATEKEALLIAIQSLQNEIIAEKNETAEKLLLLNTNLHSIKENLSRDFITTIKNLFSKLTRSKK
jgi:hypothetical protein